MSYSIEPSSSSAPAIEVRGVSKYFKLYDNPVFGPVRELLLFWKRDELYRKFQSVDNVSLSVRRGEVVGIIGPNGAGKTTLLKMIAGLLRLDSGNICIRGKVTALLALGVGVHPEFTGRENIYYSGMLLGFSREEIVAKTPAIIEFAELGDFIDQPFRTYSSGMRARLLFSISMSVEPDILIVDEALATGDSHFVAKCVAHIRSIIKKGATILYVSHNLTQVQEMCQRAVFMAEGRVQFDGPPHAAVAAYNEWAFRKEAGHVAEAAATDSASTALRPVGGTGAIRIERLTLRDSSGNESNGFHTGDAAHIDIEYASDLPERAECTCFVGLVREEDGAWVGEMNSSYFMPSRGLKVERTTVQVQRRGRLRITMEPLLLLNGRYHLWVMIYDSRERYCEYRRVAPFFVARRAHVFDRGPVFWQPCSFQASVGAEGER